MPEYLTPGVYIEEIAIGPTPIEGVSTSTAAFLGKTERGPIDPRLVTSVTQFQNLYGGYLSDSYLANAVDGFFANGGTRCYIARITRVDGTAKTSSYTINDASAKAVMKVSAIGPGVWGNSIKVQITDASLESFDATLFKLIVTYTSSVTGTTVTETYDNLSPSATSADYFESRINGISYLITVLHQTSTNTPANVTTAVSLTGGVDGTADTSGNVYLSTADYTGKLMDATTGLRVGLDALSRISDISIVCIPDENDTTHLSGITAVLISHCETARDRFAILQSPSTTSDVSALYPPQDSQYAAFYHPWVQIIDPSTDLPKYVPPGGHMAGIYARSDVNRGVWKAPANETVSGVVALKFDIQKGEQDILNPRGVNCIRSFQGQGIKVWGARTISRNALWKYVNVRRLFIFLEKSIYQGTQWVVFEPNNEALWARVKQSISQFLTEQWRAGALMGSTPEEAFFVTCDRTTMTQSDIDNGRLIVMIGVAPVKPAEFVIFRIAQATNMSSS
ncbi:MAG: Phage tail sheath protein [Methanosaeta sp. PtaU1.Bin060]|jgi:phage tail sheath protein FI|nr:MAG: Phage tail sheath protein [Methanosaeta sp. PtaU1.Bin060]